MITTTIAELQSALRLLANDIAVSVPWDALHKWAGSNPLAVEHYAQLQGLWNEVWWEANRATPAPAVYLYHGSAKLTLVRESTLDDPPAVALQDLACISVPQ
ncbi:MAG: hypothetical protein HZY77_00985 [Thiobacillus sp.]|uniref:hypothetical protein n=1 Tax=Thiobacillus sp. TaxID=924 RepID=UPI00168C99C8|nr:hypothetical protein [Thiobacillus sp.]QLQ01663.1 MAG: hypothetical protein HZY77_00985 [Thiobacillus sp.]